MIPRSSRKSTRDNLIISRVEILRIKALKQLNTAYFSAFMVPQTGVEPVTPGLGNLCSIQLSYWGVDFSAKFEVLGHIGCPIFKK